MINVLANDVDTDGTLDNTSVRIVSGPAHGTATVGTGGAITYAPTAGYSGTDSFTYSVNDNQGNPSNAAAVTLTVGSGGSNGGGASDSEGVAAAARWDCSS